MRTVEEVRNNSQVQFGNYIKTTDGDMSGYQGYLRLRDSKHTMTFMASIDTDGNRKIEHVSVCYMDSNRKTPTWEEMCAIKEIFWDDEEEVHQIHPKKSQYVHGVKNLRNVLHLWRPIEGWGDFEE
jgi:hypothetical protein